eukprot:scaffold3.g6265.t1
MESLNSKPLALSSVAGPITRRRKQLLARVQGGGGGDVDDTAVSCGCAHRGSPRKRARRAEPPPCDYAAALYVRWVAIDGRPRVSRLPLAAIAGVGALRGVFRRLIRGAFPPSELPDYLVSPEYYKFTPAEEFVFLPGDAARTEFRLAVTLADGWEHTVATRVLGAAHDPRRSMLVTVAEFESDAVEVEDQEITMNLVAYPTVCVRREFLDEAVRELALRGGAGARGACG